MNRFMITVGALMASVSLAGADPVDDTLVVNGDLEIAVRAPAPAHLDGALGDEVLSGWLYRGDETRAMEMDDFDNSGMIFVEQARDLGRGRWQRGQILCLLSWRAGGYGRGAPGLSEME